MSEANPTKMFLEAEHSDRHSHKSTDPHRSSPQNPGFPPSASHRRERKPLPSQQPERRQLTSPSASHLGSHSHPQHPAGDREISAKRLVGQQRSISHQVGLLNPSTRTIFPRLLLFGKKKRQCPLRTRYRTSRLFLGWEAGLPPRPLTSGCLELCVIKTLPARQQGQLEIQSEFLRRTLECQRELRTPDGRK